MSVKNNKVDLTALKFNQATLVVLLSVSYLLNLNWLVGFVALVLLVGTILPEAALFKSIYKYFLKPAKILKPKISIEDSSPHQFAQALGGIMLAASFLFLSIFNLQLLGWAFVLFVVALAFVNLVFNFCAGCFVYFQLGKLGLFNSQKIHGEENV